MRATNLSRGAQGSFAGRLEGLYKVWSRVYDRSVQLDPAYVRHLREMIDAVVHLGDTTLDIGRGTGLGTTYASIRASKVLAVDPSEEMTRKLEQKISRERLDNVELRRGFFPAELQHGETFDAVISSFMLPHLSPEQRTELLAQTYRYLNPGGRIGLFSAQGEIAPSFQTKDELWNNLSSAGYHDIRIRDVADVYRITTAKKTLLRV